MRIETPLPDPVLYDEIITIFLERLNVTVPSLEADLIASGVLDSLALVELLLQIESRYGIQVSLERLDFEDFRSVTSIASFIAREGSSAREPHAA